MERGEGDRNGKERRGWKWKGEKGEQLESIKKSYMEKRRNGGEY